ncbi:MAG: hypothetical protein RBS39_11065 [Phycisphaerales bacterium]|jgi:hypothetical protein|nr:hypothetical protein [Phycisphaerales bacterium]
MAGGARASDDRDAKLDAYLQSRGLDGVLSAELRRRLESATGDERLAIATRLGEAYARQLERVATPEERREVEVRSAQLLSAIPDAASAGLRLSLAKARYLGAEAIAERARVRLTTPEERQEAERVLREVEGVFRALGMDAHQRVQRLEKQEERGRESESDLLREALGEARRVRSLAFYYAGWSNTYLASLTGSPAHATAGLADFGWLLGVGSGQPATLDKLRPGLLRFEHLARAAIGCALCCSMRGDDASGVAWLRALEDASETPPGVKAQLTARSIDVLGRSRRWNDLSWLVERRRRESNGAPLDAYDARLLVIVSLEALERPEPRTGRNELAESLAQRGMADLIERGEVSNVLDLVERFGTAPIGDEGFVVLYVRGLQGFRRAREAHAAGSNDVDGPVTDETLAALYEQAGGLLEKALAAKVDEALRDERDRCALTLALCRFYSGRLVAAADDFERAFGSARLTDVREESLYLAIRALDLAIGEGQASQEERRDRLSKLFIETFPASERSARLLLARAGRGLVDDREAVELLLGVPADSPLAMSARRLAAQLLYRMYRGSPGAERDFAAMRFVQVAEELLESQRAAMSAGGTSASDPRDAEASVVLARQAVDACLGLSSPDVDRAQRLLDQLDRLAAAGGVDTRGFADELAYRRFQIALAREGVERAAELAAGLRASKSTLANSAERRLYQAVRDAWQRDRREENATRLVRFGSLVLAQFDGPPDAAMAGVMDTVSDAAAFLWIEKNDEVMRDRSRSLDRLLIERTLASRGAMRRYAELSEAAGDNAEALSAWRTLGNALTPDEDEWYEAKYNLFRLLALSDQARAAEAVRQHGVLNPEFGPDPWGSRIREMYQMLVGPLAGPAQGGTP